MPGDFRDHKRDEFLALEYYDMSFAAYEANFYALSCCTTQLFTNKKERTRHYVKGLNYDL